MGQLALNTVPSHPEVAVNGLEGLDALLTTLAEIVRGGGVLDALRIIFLVAGLIFAAQVAYTSGRIIAESYQNLSQGP